MTDKVQKIREEVEKLKLCTMDEHMKFYSDAAEAEYNALCNIEHFIDSLQEEPTGNIWHNPNEKPCYDKPFAIVSDGGELTATFTYFSNEIVRGGLDWKEFNKRYHTAKWCYIEDLYNNEESVSDDLEEASKNYALNNTPWDDCKDEIQESFKAGVKWQKAKDESTTEDLGEYINKLSRQFPEVSFAKLSRIGVRVAKWQKQQDSMPVSEELEEAARSYTNNIDNIGGSVGEQTRNAFKAGAKWQKDRMMLNTTDATCFGFQGAALFSFRLPADKYLVGSKVKVIVIKED